eukprot:gb/GEZN01024732.1/.p1 GENE.gb/GEZN01024732.1/~~gb/GEZN01024732.1/.p1  ORF type:complete len:129 (-),score=25.87 gb/GEZN01024732.1/:38-424(-)
MASAEALRQPTPNGETVEVLSQARRTDKKTDGDEEQLSERPPPTSSDTMLSHALSQLKEAFERLDAERRGYLERVQFEKLLTSYFRLSVSKEEVNDDKLRAQAKALWQAMGKDSCSRVFFSRDRWCLE